MKLDVPWPNLPLNSASKSDGVILVYAASTGASLFVVQLAKSAGYKVVATCNPHNFELVKSYGADAVYDYHSASALNDIKEAYSQKHIPRFL